MQFKKILCVVLMLCLALSSCVFVSAAAVETQQTEMTATQDETASTADEASADETTADEKDYGLMESIQEGNILHAFCWKHTDITAMLPEIAEAGFTAVQVSPVQSLAGEGPWWWSYQPVGFYIGSNPMGDKTTLTELCAQAEKYGIKIVVEVVANHLAGDHSIIQEDLKDSQYWHTYSEVAYDGDRYRVTNGHVGMPDLNTAHPYVQQCVRSYVLELKSVGVDGIYWDAAKHIGLPSEGDNFWSVVTKNTGLYHYGQILDNPGVDINSDQGKALLKEYTEYMSITDSSYGAELRNSFDSKVTASSIGVFVNLGISSDKLVYWGESHDNWSNNMDWGYSNGMSQNTIDRAYAVAGSRDGAAALYLSRPFSAERDSIIMGAKGSTHFTSAEVAAVNHFRNLMNGQDEYVTSGNNCTVVCRERGAVIVAGSGSSFSVTVPNGGGLVEAGTYVDEITGSVWTVTDTEITGKIGESGIAVIYDPAAKPSTPDEGSRLLGDADGDGKVNIKDATLIQKYVAEVAQIEKSRYAFCDVNADSNINIKDATAIQKFVAEIDTDFKIGEEIE